MKLEWTGMEYAGLPSMPLLLSDDETTNSPGEVPFVLPKHVRFARSLALVSGAVIGIAAGATVFGSGCESTKCQGFCGFGVQAPVDAQYDRPVDRASDRADGSADAREVASDGHSGGGPGPAPRLPANWPA
jgi:hypothetical protein